MSTPIVWTTWRSYSHRMKGKVGGDLKSRQPNRFIQTEKKKKGGSLETMTEAILGFIEMRNWRLNRSIDSTPQLGESFVGGDQFSINKALTLLNEHIDVDHFTCYKVVTKLHNPQVVEPLSLP